ncbi:MAG TPA: hypothetical protein VMM81_06360 [Acidimicrobiia bacterium]|nr:hypothetical protein [Acidimicrobiia bacterium]
MADRSRRVLIEADERGRVSLARFGMKSIQLVAEPTDDGGLIIHPAVALTVAEAAHYGDPEAVQRLEQALAAADDGQVKPFNPRSGS